jgi:hypothetical protein
MPRNRFTRVFLPLGVLALALHAVLRRPDAWEYEDEPEAPETAGPDEAAAAPARRRSAGRRAAVAAGFTTVFFAGAAFTAGAGDQAAQLLEGDPAELVAAPAETPADPAEGAPAAELPAEETPAEEALLAPEDAEAAEAELLEESLAEESLPEESLPEESLSEEQTDEAEAEAGPTPDAEPAVAASVPAGPSAEPAAAPAATARAAARPRPAPARPSPALAVQRPARATSAPKVAHAPAAPPVPEIEEEHGDEPTVWLNRELPDPTPPSARLSKAWAGALRAAAKRHRADWALVLAVLRAQERRGAAPATPAELDALGARLAGRDAWKAALALSGKTAFADEVEALRDLYRFVGLRTLVEGFEASQDRLTERLLEREGVWIYEGGRADLEAGRIDVRVVALLGFLARRYETITVSSLFSGHRMFSRPGVVSAHMYGHAVDIAALGGTPIFGNSLPGGLTEDAVRSILLLPSELQPRQVISLLGLGGPSFPLRNHADHIHVGY